MGAHSKPSPWGEGAPKGRVWGKLYNGGISGVPKTITLLSLPQSARKKGTRLCSPEQRKVPSLYHLSVLSQHSFAPAGMASSIIIRFSFSSPFSVWMADSSMPLDSRLIIFRGGRLVMATRVLPISSSGL